MELAAMSSEGNAAASKTDGEALPKAAALSSVAAEVPRIRVRNLVKRFRTKRGDVTALDHVSLDVSENEKVVLLGPSGCGKTTLLRCVAGLEEPDEGQIEINGKVVFSSDRRIFVPPERRGISMVFQSYALWPHLTVRNNVAYPLVNRGVPKAEIGTRVEEALALVGCEGLLQRYPSQLSGGQQQRVSLARAIVSSEGVVLFDEPLSNVDAKVREQLRVELVAMQRRLAFSALYVTHDQTEATAVGHRIAVMDVGQVAQIGRPREVYDSPSSRYVANFVGATNELPGKVVGREGECLKIDTPIGVIRSTQCTDLQTDTKVVVMVRPEHLRFARGTVEPGSNVLVGVLESAMFLGLYNEYLVAFGDKRMIVRSTHHEGVDEGASAEVSIDPANVLVFVE